VRSSHASDDAREREGEEREQDDGNGQGAHHDRRAASQPATLIPIQSGVSSTSLYPHLRAVKP
jgi:hypothetical protein